MTLTPAWLDELRARTALSTLIGKSIKVTRAGREWKACCPFHNEKTPSFTINDEKGFYHCLAGDTQVITRQGRAAIASLAGQQVEILSRNGLWIRAPFKAYGEQQLWKIILRRNQVRKEVFATSGHRWFVRGRTTAVETTGLRPGHRLESVMPPPRSDWSVDPDGVRHGIVFGDGSMYQATYGTVNLHGEKDAQLRHWFPAQSHQVHERPGGQLYLRVYGGRAFTGFKDLPPIGSSDAYLLGFLAGYLAADGHVAKDGTVMLNSADADAVEAVRDICTNLGIVTYGRTTVMRRGFGKEPSALHRIHFVPSTMAEPMFLLETARRRFAAGTKKFARLRWAVDSVQETSRIEPVYCAEVPGEHAFAIDDNILTGNCFGCGAHGDAIRWMTEQRGLPFMDAVKELAAAAGMDVPAPDPRAAARQEAQKSLRDVTEAAAIWFQDRLESDEGAAARSYLQRRGLSAELCRSFGIGFAPDARSRMRDLLSPYGDAMAIEAGMLIQPPDDAPADRREPYDRFRGRLMIPIRDVRGRVIAFGGRTLGDGEPKYLNSPDTPLFDKGRVLFNLDRAAAAARRAERLILVEGYMDVIALAQAGIEEAVAPLGTALTETQIELAWRHAPVPLLAFDGDAAGQRAALRAALRALPLLRPGFSLGFVALPSGKDPDDVVRDAGREAFDRLCADATPLVDLLWQAALAGQTSDTPEDRAAVRATLMGWSNDIADRDIAAHYRHAFRERLDARFFTRTAPANPLRGGSWPKAKPERAPSRALRNVGGTIGASLADAIIGGLLRHPAAIAGHAEALHHLPVSDPVSASLLSAMIDIAFAHEGLDTEGMLTILGQSAEYNKATNLLRADGMQFSFTRPPGTGEPNAGQTATEGLPADALRDLDEAIAAAIAWPEIERALEDATEAMRTRMDNESFAEQQRLLKAKADLTARLMRMAEAVADN